jgi:hypothetical protein
VGASGKDFRLCRQDGENQPDETLLISFAPALVANSLLSRAGEAYDARDRGPNRKSRFQIGLQYLTTMDHHMKESFYD